MKKLLILAILALCGCATFEGDIVEEVELQKSGWIKYSTTRGSSIFSQQRIYNVGDTIHFCK